MLHKTNESVESDNRRVSCSKRDVGKVGFGDVLEDGRFSRVTCLTSSKHASIFFDNWSKRISILIKLPEEGGCLHEPHAIAATRVLIGENTAFQDLHKPTSCLDPLAWCTYTSQNRGGLI